MAIAHRGTGAAVFGQNSITPAIPAAAVTGDMMLLLVAGKPYNGSISAPAGWSPLGVYTDGTVAAGVDVGSMVVTAWWKEHDGSEANPQVTEGATTWDVFGALVMAFSKGAGEVWDTPVDRGGGDANHPGRGVDAGDLHLDRAVLVHHPHLVAGGVFGGEDHSESKSSCLVAWTWSCRRAVSLSPRTTK